MKKMLKFISLRQKRTSSTTIGRTPHLLILLAFSISLLALTSGCEYDIADLDTASGSALQMNADQTDLQKKQAQHVPGPAQVLVSGLQGASGSTIGPGGALFVTEGALGRIIRVDPRTGNTSIFASGLPPSIVGIGGVNDLAFIGGTAYALVTLVGADVGGNSVVGIYRIDGPSSFTVIADIGAFSSDPDNEPETDYFVPTGVQYAIQTYRGAFLVTDGHHNRVLHVTLDGEITEIKTFGNIVPTGLALHGNTIYMTQAGPVPHLPQNGKVVSFGPNSAGVTNVASGARLLVDVEFGRGNTLFALSQGEWDGVAEGSPAIENDGSLLRVNEDGTFAVISEGLDRPTSMEFIGNTAYIIGLSGEIVTIENVDSPPFGI